MLEGVIRGSDDILIHCVHKRQRENNSNDHVNLAAIERERKSVSRKYRDICYFCTPLRCRTCEERIYMIPSIVSLLVKNDFIGTKELGVLESVYLHGF